MLQTGARHLAVADLKVQLFLFFSLCLLLLLLFVFLFLVVIAVWNCFSLLWWWSLTSPPLFHTVSDFNILYLPFISNVLNVFTHTQIYTVQT